MNEELEVWWSGSDKDRYLCVVPFTTPDLSHIRPMALRGEVSLKQYRPYRDRGAMRALILKTLKARGPMTVKALRAIVEPNDTQFYNLLTRMAEQGLVERSGRGLVALRRSGEQI